MQLSGAKRKDSGVRESDLGQVLALEFLGCAFSRKSRKLSELL